MGWLSRFRHSMGFGVHSPFAFRMIKECIEEKCRYYAYAELPGKRERLLYRVAVFFQPSEIEEIGQADASAARLACPSTPVDAPLRLSCPGAPWRRPPMWMGVERTALAVCNAQSPLHSVADALDKGKILFITDQEGKVVAAAEAHLDKLGHGMAFVTRHGSIIVPWEKLPRIKTLDLRL